MYTLHYWPDSASLIIRLILDELGLPYALRKIDRAAGALNSPDYRAMNPLGQIPALETPDGPMFETAAILLYLTERHPGLAPAPGTPDRAAFLKWLFFTSSNLHPAMLQLYYPERTAGPDNSATVVAHATARLTDLLAVLETANPRVLSATTATALGYYLAVLMRWIAKDIPSRTYPNLHAMLTFLETRPAAIAAAQAEGLGVKFFSDPG